MAKGGDRWNQEPVAITTTGQNLRTIVSTEARVAIDFKLQNNSAATLYVNLSGDVTHALVFASGGTTAIAVGDTIEGETGGATAKVVSIDIDTGSWAGGDAAGTLYVDTQSGTFESETLKVGSDLNLATITTDTDKTRMLNVPASGGTLEFENILNDINVMGSAAGYIVFIPVRNAGRGK